MVTLTSVSEHSHAERLSRRIELSAEELSLLLGPERFEPAGLALASDTAPEPSADLGSADRGSADLGSADLGAVEPKVAPPPADAVSPPTGAPRAVGDIDLVQAIMEAAPNFEQLALRAIRERTGEDLARIVTGSAADAMVAAGTGSPLDDGRAFVAPLAPDARAAWAAWLRRWLELASTVSMRAPKGLWDDATGFPAWQRMRPQVAHRVASARLRREAIFVSVLRVEDSDLWNRRSQVLVDQPFLARAATALDAAIMPGDELGRLDDGGFVVVSARELAARELAEALRSEIARLPGDGPRSLVVHIGSACAPWDATQPDALLELATLRAAGAGSGR
jgi:GGDEF domain-containing protein